jgi:5'-phosphate synthase pdxT subunit
MVKNINIGVVAVQGAISEHLSAAKKAIVNLGLNGQSVSVKNQKELNGIDGLIIPGGESTTIFRILNQSELLSAISKLIKENDLPVMGTCAGCILLAKDIVGIDSVQIKTLQAMNMQVERNVFGRQRESFEKEITVNGLSTPFNAVFIRAPIITKVWDNCTAISKFDNKKIIAARQNKCLALSFHPELVNDLRMHEYFLNMI